MWVIRAHLFQRSSADFFWLVVEPTHLKNISQIGNLPQIGVKIKNIWNHHLVLGCFSYLAVLDHEIKPFERLIFPTTYAIPKSLKPVSHWLSKFCLGGEFGLETFFGRHFELSVFLKHIHVSHPSHTETEPCLSFSSHGCAKGMLSLTGLFFWWGKNQKNKKHTEKENPHWSTRWAPVKPIYFRPFMEG